MDGKYVELFKQVAHTAEILAEQVMDYNKNKNDKKAMVTAQKMRDDYAKLYDRMRADNFNPDSLEYIDFTKLLLAAIMVTQNIETRIKNETKALEGYKVDLLPKLQRVISEKKANDDIKDLVEELFTINI